MYRKEDKIMETIINEEMKEEILKIRGIATYSDAIIACEIAKKEGLTYLTKDCDIFCLLGRIYKYGKIQGIREERAKRKKALANNKLTKATI